MSACRPTARLPSRSSAPMALAGFAVDIVTTCGSVKPSPRKRVMISVMLCTVLSAAGHGEVGADAVGQQALLDACAGPTSKLKFIRPCAVSNHTPRSRRLARLRHELAVGVEHAAGIGGEVVGEDVALLEQRQQRADHLRVVALLGVADVHHQRDAALARPPAWPASASPCP